MSLRRGALPKSVRRALSPVGSTTGSVKRSVMPKPVRTVQYVRHPGGTATTRLGRAVRKLFR